MLGRVIAISSALAMVALFILWQNTTPSTIGPLGVLFVFILMYVSVLGVLTFLLFGLNKIIVKLSTSVTVRKPINRMTLGRSYYFASVIALAPVMVIGMQSVGEVGLYELLLVVLFVGIACIYIAKRTN
jgi:hypothetical protein